MDAFFATSKGGKSSGGNTCGQLFVTDKGFACVILMRTKSEVPDAVKQFSKEVSTPDAIICDASVEQASTCLKKFLCDTGNQLRVLEEETPWTNKAELHVGLIKEATRKDMREADSPLAF